MSDHDMRDFWNARATENAFYYVDNRVVYADPDMDEFWEAGVAMVDVMLERLGIALRGHERVVEIGCGVGRVTRVLAARAREVTAVDVSTEMIDRARELNPHLENVEWVVGDGRTLGAVETGGADACFSTVVFQHVPDPAITLGYVDEVGRVLAPGGWAALQVSNDPAVHRARPLRERARASIRGLLGRGPRGQAHRAWLGSAVDIDELSARAQAAGLTTQHVDGAGTQYCHVLLTRSARESPPRSGG